MNYEKYQPVLMNHKAELADAMQRDGFKEAWDELNDEYDILKIIIKSQKVFRINARRNYSLHGNNS